jgi:RNA polymerase sigma factor (sigma-70 family)
LVTTHLGRVVGHLRDVLATRETRTLSDPELWARYVYERDEAAFEALVRRHGPMVLTVCRRILRNETDAEDAFQATFLVLVRRAASIRSPDTIGNWLHGVARRTALQARSAAARRRAKETAVAARAVAPPAPIDDVRVTLDEEIGRLAERYRIAVVLCDLEGKTRREAAEQLGWAEGTVASRLARGRGILAKRLERRGLAGALVAAAVTDMSAGAGVPSALVFRTIRATSLFAAGEATAKSAVSGTVAALTQGVLKSMLLTKLKGVVAVSLVVGMATLSGGALISRSRATEPAAATADGHGDAQNDPDDLHDRVRQLKQQLEQVRRQIEQEGLARTESGNDGFPGNRFKYRIPFETGYKEYKEGGHVEIREVWGTRPRIEVGGQYLVRGKYVLPPGEHGTLYFYETADGAWGQTPTADLDLQRVRLTKERGDFELMHGMAGPGYFHLYLAAPERYSRSFANVYFGTGENVWRKKP